jgi:hypothetical protein
MRDNDHQTWSGPRFEIDDRGSRRSGPRVPLLRGLGVLSAAIMILIAGVRFARLMVHINNAAAANAANAPAPRPGQAPQAGHRPAPADAGPLANPFANLEKMQQDHQKWVEDQRADADKWFESNRNRAAERMDDQRQRMDQLMEQNRNRAADRMGAMRDRQQQFQDRARKRHQELINRNR